MSNLATLLSALSETGVSEIEGATGEKIFFWITAPLMILGALGLVFAKKAVHAALSMAVVMVNLGLVYLALQAPFLGVVQIFVYTGAVMMLFLFVLMLVGVDASDSLVETLRGQRLAAGLLGAGLLVLFIGAIGNNTYGQPVLLDEVNGNVGNINSMAFLIFGSYVWAFEATSALLITAALGGMVLAYREPTSARLGQRELSKIRIASGKVKAPLPAPGVYARHNAVDTPALLPDGTPSPLSVSRVLTARGQNQSVEGRADQVASTAAELAAREDS